MNYNDSSKALALEHFISANARMRSLLDRLEFAREDHLYINPDHVDWEAVGKAELYNTIIESILAEIDKESCRVHDSTT